MYTQKNNDKLHFIDMFNEIYTKTFKLRTDISLLSQSIMKCDFYYETDIIMQSKQIQEVILDYLTEMENYFSFAMKISVWKTFKLMTSVAFYQRIASLYSFIYIYRKSTGNNELFKNYVKAVEKMKNIPKIAKNIKNPGNKCYVGIRASDMAYSNSFFQENICFFSNNNIAFSKRINQNIVSKEVYPYMRDKLLTYISNNPDSNLYFYNQATAYNYGDEILRHCKCINPKSILDLLGNKEMTREWLSQCNIPIVAYKTFIGREIQYSLLTKHFPSNEAFVIQAVSGGGGIGTFYADKMNFSQVLKQLQPLERYIVSPYLRSISANTHIFVSNKQTVLSPASMQIIEKRNNQLCYRGGDFCAFEFISSDVKEKVKNLSLRIANLLREKGYCGIAGLDFIITAENIVYCSEINARFQASTFLLDKYLQSNKLSEHEAASCFELNDMAFHGGMVTSLSFEDHIGLSCYYYYKDDIPLECIQEKIFLFQKNDVEIQKDGLDYYLNDEQLTSNSYLFRAVFPYAICSNSPDTTLWINNNIAITPLSYNELSIKVALLNQGVRLSTDILDVDIKKGVYQSIDIRILNSNFLQKGRNLNCAYGIHLSQFSPFYIEKKGNNYVLLYYKKEIAQICIEKNLLADFSAREQKIAYLSTDRLRINLVAGCENKNIGKGCSFCNLPPSEIQFSMKEIRTALIHIKQLNIPFRHILIGGGSCLANDIWDKVIELSTFLKNDDWYCTKPISLMTMLPPIDLLPYLKDAGIEEVAFNMEISNEQLATKLMPGKRNYGKETYYNIFSKSVRIFGIGNVRTALIVGLDKEQELYDEIVTLINMEVVPCLSAFRALPNTPFEKMPGPDNDYLIKVYNNCVKLIASIPNNINELGPKCHSCRNNMLVL